MHDLTKYHWIISAHPRVQPDRAAREIRPLSDAGASPSIACGNKSMQALIDQQFRINFRKFLSRV